MLSIGFLIRLIHSAMKQSYSTKELARMLDVSESTVKRWADAGLLRCRKTIGGHRKFEHRDVVEFQHHCGLAVKLAMSGSEAADMDGQLDELFAAGFACVADYYRGLLLGGRFNCVSWLLSEAHMRGYPLATIADEIIAPAMRQIGELWRAGKISVLDEHTATFATIRALAQMRASSPAKREGTGRVALVGCSEGELHELAAQIACDLLESYGWKVIYLGPHTPLFSFAEAIARFKADLVCISITMTDNIERAARDYERLRRDASKRGAKVVMGGAALCDEGVRARFRSALYSPTLDDFLKQISSGE